MKKIPSSTVLEAMIALLLVTIVVSIATVVFAKFANSGKTPAFMRAQEAVENMVSMNIEELKIDGFIIRKEVIPLEHTTSRRLRFTITDSTGKLLDSHDRIITE